MIEVESMTSNSQNDQHETVVNFEAEDEVQRAELRTPEQEGESLQFAKMMEEKSSLQKEILSEARAQGIPTHIIDLPPMMTPHYDDNEQMYVTDCNNVIRYYINVGSQGEGELVPTDEFIKNAQTVESNERNNDFETIYSSA